MLSLPFGRNAPQKRQPSLCQTIPGAHRFSSTGGSIPWGHGRAVGRSMGWENCLHSGLGSWHTACIKEGDFQKEHAASCQVMKVWLAVRNNPKSPEFLCLCLCKFSSSFFFSSFLFSNLLGINLLLLVFFFPPLCELLPFSSCLTEQCSMSQCWQAKYWMVKCYFLKQHERAHQQKMVQDYRHWKKHHVHLMLAVHIMCLHLGV